MWKLIFFYAVGMVMQIRWVPTALRWERNQWQRYVLLVIPVLFAIALTVAFIYAVSHS